MKRIIAYIAAMCSFIPHTLMSQVVSPPVLKAKSLLERIITIEFQTPWDMPAAPIESGERNLRKIPEFVELQQVAGASWSSLVDNIQLVAPSRLSKAVLFVSFQSLPEDDYLQFVDKAVGLTENHTIDKQLLYWAFIPAGKNVRGIIGYTYDKPVTRDILRRIKVLYADDANIISFCNGILSGESEREGEAYYDENPNDPRPGPALRHRATASPSPTASRSAAL